MAERGGAGPDDSGEIAAQLSALGTKLDRVTYLLVGLLVLQLLHVFGITLLNVSSPPCSVSSVHSFSSSRSDSPGRCSC